MADSKESFEILEDASGNGVSPTASQIGEASLAKIGMTVFPFRDSSGNLRMPEVNASNILKGDVVGSVTANAGTNLNTSALALETTQADQSVRIGALVETAPGSDTASSGLNGRLQRIAQRITSLITSTTDGTQKTKVTNGTNDAAVTNTTVGLADYGLVVRELPYRPNTYSAAASGFASAATPTDIWRMIGSATKTITIKRIRLSGTTTSGSPITVSATVVKRSAANTGGTIVASSLVSHDSINPAATALVGHYTANPTALGTAVGPVRSQRITFQQAGVSGGEVIWSFGDDGQPLTLRGVAENITINLGSTTVTGSLLSISVEWVEV